MTTTIVPDPAIYDEPPRTAEQALHQHGLNGDRLLKLAHRIAQDAQRQAPAGLGGKYEDLVSFLTLQALEAAIRYNPAQSGNGYTFASYLCDIMERRVPDFYRRKSEGFGDSDRRSGADNRITLAGDTLDDHLDTDVDFDRLLSERRLSRYQRAATITGIDISEWIVITLDIAARHAEKHAA